MKRIQFFLLAAVVCALIPSLRASPVEGYTDCYVITNPSCWSYLAQVIPCMAGCPTCCALPVANNPVTNMHASGSPGQRSYTPYLAVGQCCYNPVHSRATCSNCFVDTTLYGCLNCWFDVLSGDPC